MTPSKVPLSAEAEHEAESRSRAASGSRLSRVRTHIQTKEESEALMWELKVSTFCWVYILEKQDIFRLNLVENVEQADQ